MRQETPASLAVAILVITGISLWEACFQDLYLHKRCREARTEEELVSACSRLCKRGNPRSLGIFVEALLRASNDHSIDFHHQLVGFCRRHWGGNKRFVFDGNVDLPQGIVRIHIETWGSISSVKLTSLGRVLYEFESRSSS